MFLDNWRESNSVDSFVLKSVQGYNFTTQMVAPTFDPSSYILKIADEDDSIGGAGSTCLG